MLFPFFSWGHRLPRRLDLPDADELSSEELVELIETGGLATRIAAARELALRGDPRAFSVLLEGLDNRHFRYAALEGLRFLGDQRAEEHAVSVMDRAFANVFERTQAAGILAAIGSPRGAEHLDERLKRRKRDDDRGLAIELVAEVGLHEAAPELERTARDPDDIFRGAALKALARLDSKRFEPLLCEIARDEREDSDVRADVIEALAKMPGRQARAAVESALESGCQELSELAGELLEEGSEEP